MIKRLRLKFVATNMIIVTILLCVILGLVYYFTSYNLESESITMLRSIAASPPQPEPGDMAGDVHLPFFSLILDPYGGIADAHGGYFDLTDADELQNIADAAWKSNRTLGVIEEYNLRYYRQAMPGGDVVVFADITSERATLSGLTQTCVIIGVIGFLAFLWVSIALSRWAVRPVERALAEQREFVASASHELKTPLTVIMTNAEILSETGDPPPKQVGNILTMSKKMRLLIEQLLNLARAENDGEQAPLEQVDLSRIVETGALTFEPVCFEHGLTLTADIVPEVFIEGDERQLAELTGILLDNAVEYSSQGGEIVLSVKDAGRRRCLLSVKNDGEPIPSSELVNIFKRFYRAAGTRDKPGSGLGLSIAESIVRRHKGRIWAESGPGFNCFNAEFPAVRAKSPPAELGLSVLDGNEEDK